MINFERELENLEIVEVETCNSCCGWGVIDLGDPENGVEIECPTCLGEGKVEIL